MDLSVLSTKEKSNTGTFLHLLHPGKNTPIYDGNDRSKPVGLYLLGKDSDAFNAMKHKKLNARLADKAPVETTSEQMEENSIDLIASLTAGWTNLSINGKSEFTKENVVELYSQLPWVFEQADAFIGNRANFI